jgi:uncharacterized membrane protein (UPF0127 family)
MKITKAIATSFILIGILSAPNAQAKEPIVDLGANNKVKVEVASTEAQITKGLMYRTSMPEDQGMIFLFHPQRSINFWMFHTLIPLDMLFIRDGKIIDMFENVPPCHAEDPSQCATYPQGPGLSVTEVLELNGGYAKRHNIHVGDPVNFDLP